MNLKQLCVAAVVEIAASKTPLQARDLGRRLGDNPRAFEVHFQKLVKAGILKGIRGPRGGYELAAPANKMSVWDIFSTISTEEDQLVLTHDDAQSMSACAVYAAFEDADNDRARSLRKFTLDELVAACPPRTEALAAE
jgi:Rrf2 family iron-sulfur cluster assembly transcriptional regulator